LPAADVALDLVDLAFASTGPFEAGATVEATNRGEQVHEVAVYRLEDGRSVQDVVDAALAGGGVSPAAPAGGIGFVDPGRSARFRLPGGRAAWWLCAGAAAPRPPPRAARRTWPGAW